MTISSSWSMKNDDFVVRMSKNDPFSELVNLTVLDEKTPSNPCGSGLENLRFESLLDPPGVATPEPWFEVLKTTS